MPTLVATERTLDLLVQRCCQANRCTTTSAADWTLTRRTAPSTAEVERGRACSSTRRIAAALAASRTTPRSTGLTSAFAASISGTAPDVQTIQTTASAAGPPTT